jgi:hypothetical protein
MKHESIDELANEKIIRPASVSAAFMRALARRSKPPKNASIAVLRLWHRARLESAADHGR